MLLAKLFKPLTSKLRCLTIPMFYFGRQRLIQYTPKQIEFIHSKSNPKLLNFVKPLTSYFTVCIIGLPNSGKSTLYNCIAG
jgi:GTP1/Obg family GTP-binding protein